MIRKNRGLVLFGELILIFIFGLIPRLWRLPWDLQITYDQGLHSQAVWDIWHNGQISLLGHPTDVDGIYHAPIYYWLMLPLYVLGKGNPIYPAIWQSITQAFSSVLIYILALKIFNRTSARISAVLFASSFGLVSYARWLSNVNPIIPFSILFFISLWYSRYKSPYWYILSCFLSALLIEFNGAIGIFLTPLLIIYFPISSISFLLPFLVFLLPHLPLLFFNLRHQWISLRAILNYSTSNQTGLGLNIDTISHDIRILTDEIYKIFSWNFWPLTITLILLTVLVIYKYFHHSSIRFAFICFVIPILGLFVYQRGAIGFFYWATLPLFIILAGFSLTQLINPIKYGLFLFLTLYNIFLWKYFLVPGFDLTPIGTRNLITHTDRIKIIDWIYQQSSGRPIYLWTYTIPYLLDHPWSYYFVWYGQPKYGYLPVSFGGLSAVQIPQTAVFFAIYESDYIKPENQQTWFNKLNNEFPYQISKYRSHDALVELRK